ncbi:hypothetical protein Y1Q_0000803 [Alligator mississippiensis]|uniref:Secreted protein n=1 Tax=Alligator mississippiensis TaxID=8496 RepID=A0A151PIX8_ALLMI|nr:hypothetical protein Y1Q_0000803 [Alligator mississippiensis]
MLLQLLCFVSPSPSSAVNWLLPPCRKMCSCCSGCHGTDETICYVQPVCFFTPLSFTAAHLSSLLKQISSTAK